MAGNGTKQTYSKQDLDNMLEMFKLYLQSPEERKDSPLLSKVKNQDNKELDALFFKSVVLAEQDIEKYVSGDLDISEDAYDSMKRYIETFGKDYTRDINGKPVYKYTKQAEQALKKLEQARLKLAYSKQQQSVNTDNKVKAPQTSSADTSAKTAFQAQTGKSKIERKNSHNSASNQLKNSLQDDTKQTLGRIRSDDNITNETALALVRLNTLKNVGIISDNELQTYMGKLRSSNLDEYRQAISFAEEKENKVKDIKTYKKALTERILQDKQVKLLTPELTVFAYDNIKERLNAASKEQAPQEEVSRLNGYLGDLTEQMDSLQYDFHHKRGYFLLDTTNAADAYDGYSDMFGRRIQNLDEQIKELQEENDNKDEAQIQIAKAQNKKEEYLQSEQDLDEIISEYDNQWNLQEIDNRWSDAVDVNDRVKRNSAIVRKIKFDEETLGAEVLSEISKFKFHDSDGKVIPQFIDPNNSETKSDAWHKGLIVAPDSRLATVLKLAGNDILMESLGKRETLSRDDAVTQLKDKIPFKLFEMYNSEEIIRQAIEDPEKFTRKKEEYFAKFREDLNNPEVPLYISEAGYNAAIDRQVNNVEVFANRLDKKLGKDKSEFVKSALFSEIRDIDRQAPARGRSKKQVKTNALKRALWGVGIGGGMAYLGARVVTNAGASGGVSLIGSSALALGTAITVGAAATAIQVWSRKRAAKRRGEKYGWKEFKKDHMLHASIATTTLACASAAFAMANAPELAVPCAMASFGLGAGLRFAQPYRELRLKGHNRATALALGAANTAAVFVGGYFGRQHGLNDIIPSTHEEVIGYKDVKVGEVRTYSQDLISKVTERNNTNSMWEYRGEGPHNIDAYRTPDNYNNEAWWTPEQHDKAIAALKEQMPKLGWKEGVGNEEVMLRKLASFERLHRDEDFVLGSGQTVAEKYGDYKELLHNLLEGRLSDEGAKQLDAIQYDVGENGHSRILDSLGKELYSYQEHEHGIIKEDIIKQVPETAKVPDATKSFGGGVFGWVVSSWNKFKDKIRPGAKADRVENKFVFNPKPEPRPEPRPEPKPEPRPEPKPEPKKEDETQKLLLDEYKIVHGVEPLTEKGKDKDWIDFCKNVEKERKSTAPDMKMNEFLLERRKKLDDLIMNNTNSVSETQSGERVQKDYLVKKAKDDRGKAHIVMEARQNLRQSNLTPKSWKKITLSHFTKFMEHYLAHDEVVADGSRNIELNPKLKREFKSENSKMTFYDLNKYLVEGKSLEESSFKGSGRDAPVHMREILKNTRRKEASLDNPKNKRER